MLRTATLLACLLCALPATAQITITEAYFPAAGDTLRYGESDSLMAAVNLLSPGPDRQWDFGTQTAVDTQLQIIRPYDDNPEFPDAEVTVAIDSANLGYYEITDTTYELVGIRGTLTDVLPGFEYSAPVTPGRAQRRAPLQYQDRYVSTTVNTIAVAVDSLPEEVLDEVDEFRDLLVGVDSIRIVSTSERTDVVDAHGTLTINGQTYEVLRERRMETSSASLFIKIGFLETDITSTILSQQPDLSNFLGEQEPTTTYYYWTNTDKEAVAIVAADGTDAARSLRFILGDVTNSVRGPQLTQAQVRVYPNPARDLTTFEAAGLESGSYTLRVVNMLGREVIRQQLTSVDGRVRTEVNVSQLPRGPYIYSMTNERGRILTTRRLLVNR